MTSFTKGISVMFDLDGTLLDHTRASNAAVLAALAQAWLPGQPLAQEDVLVEWGRLEEIHMSDYLAGTIDFAEQRRRRLRGLLAWAGRSAFTDDAEADEAFTAYIAAYEAHWCPFDDVHPTLDLLAQRGLPMAILTNGQRAQQHAKVSSLGLPVDVPVLVPADVGAAKPAAEAFIGACATLGWEPGHVLYVGDNPDADARGSLAAGLSACWLNRDRIPSPFTGDEGITEISGLAELVDLLGQ